MPTLSAIYRYPVKGLTPEELAEATVARGGVIAHDRAYAIENGPSGFDSAAPTYFPKVAFLMLMRNERLAELRSRFDPATATLTIARDGTVVATGRLDLPAGRRAIES